MWDEITYPFLNFNGATAEFWEWIGNFISHFIGRVITYPCWFQQKLFYVSKGVQGYEKRRGHPEHNL